MVDIQAIERSIMTTTDEKMLKQMAESMPFDIYSRLSPEARSKLVKALGPGRVVPASEPGGFPLKKTPKTDSRAVPVGVHGAVTVKTEFERMMDEVAAVIVKYGYRNLGYQQTLSGEDLLRFIKGRDLIDVVAEFGIDEERYESVMQFENQG